MSSSYLSFNAILFDKKRIHEKNMSFFKENYGCNGKKIIFQPSDNWLKYCLTEIPYYYNTAITV